MTARLAQVAVATRDLDASERFYTEQLGLRFLFRKPNIVALGAGDVRLLLSASPDVQAPSPPGVMFYLEAVPIEAVHARIGGGSAPTCVAQMNGVEIWIATVLDPSGIPVGLIEQRATRSEPSSAAGRDAGV